MVLTDFYQAFDTVCFKTMLKKFYKLDFPKTILNGSLAIYLVKHNSHKLMTPNHTSNCHSLEYLKDQSLGQESSICVYQTFETTLIYSHLVLNMLMTHLSTPTVQ